jgi:hypothetical protein
MQFVRDDNALNLLIPKEKVHVIKFDGELGSELDSVKIVMRGRTTDEIERW